MTFLTMLLISSFQVLIKSIFIVVLGSIALSYAWIFLACEMELFLGLKLLRGDLQYWIPISGLTGVVISIIIRSDILKRSADCIAQ